MQFDFLDPPSVSHTPSPVLPVSPSASVPVPSASVPVPSAPVPVPPTSIPVAPTSPTVTIPDVPPVSVDSPCRVFYSKVSRMSISTKSLSESPHFSSFLI